MDNDKPTNKQTVVEEILKILRPPEEAVADVRKHCESQSEEFLHNRLNELKANQQQFRQDIINPSSL